MRVLVTGAAGFIGSCLVADRVRRGDEVVAHDLKPGTWPEGAEARVKDLGELGVEDLRGVDVVFHLAAAHLDQSTPADEYERVNVHAVRELVRRAKEAGVRRFVHCSSVGVYGHVANPPAAEDAPKSPANIYERTKLAGDAAALEEGQRSGLEVVVVRPAWVYGAACPRTRRLLRMVARGRFFYFGRGRNLRHPVHIDDMLEGFHLAADRGPAGAIYNIAGPRALPLHEMIATAARALDRNPPRLKVPFALGWCAAIVLEALFGLLGKQPPISRRSLVFFRNVNAYAIDAAREGLGYEPRVELEEGMRWVVTALGGADAIASGRTAEPPALNTFSSAGADKR